MYQGICNKNLTGELKHFLSDPNILKNSAFYAEILIQTETKVVRQLTMHFGLLYFV